MKKIFKCFLLVTLFIAFSCTNNVMQKVSKKADNNKPLIINQESKNEIEDLGENWYKVTATKQIMNITPEQAEKEAINKARTKAIEYACGIEVNSATLNIQAESSFSSLIDYFSKITSLMSQGFILEEKILRNNTKTENGILTKEVTIKVKVGKQKGEKDPYFNLIAELNKNRFIEGENLEVSITPTKNCYLSIFCIYSNDKVGMLLPNEYRKDNFANANMTFKFPGKNDNFSIPISLLSGKNEDSEMIMIIATKKLISFPSFKSFSSYNTYEATINELMNKLIKLPRNEMEIENLQYYVYKN